MDFHELRERALIANVKLVRAGLVTLTFGNASAADRVAGMMAIKPSGVPFAELAPDAFPVLEIATGVVVDGRHRPSSDAPSHLVLYRAFEEIGGIVHTHSPFATAWAQARRDLPCLGTTHADHFRGSVPVTRPLSADEIGNGYEEATGEVIVETLRKLRLRPLDMPAILVASHGPFTWGPGSEAAVDNAVALEAAAATAYRTLMLSPDVGSIEDELLTKHFSRKHGPAAYYGQPA